MNKPAKERNYNYNNDEVNLREKIVLRAPA